jgi:hypothetical protein
VFELKIHHFPQASLVIKVLRIDWLVFFQRDVKKSKNRERLKGLPRYSKCKMMQTRLNIAKEGGAIVDKFPRGE